VQDDYGNRYACWRRDEILRGEVFSVSLEYYVSAFGVNFCINSSIVKPYNTSSILYQKHTQPEELIQSKDAEIVSKATEIVGKEKNPHLIANEIYQFVINRLTYEEQEKERGALWALRNKKGDCSEFSYLFVALCRAAGIPSRIQTGFAFHKNTETFSDGHMWAEYYLENYGWIPVDATWHLFDEIDNHHFSSLQSKPELMSYSNYVFNYSQTGSGEPSDNQTVVAEEESIHIFADFPNIQSINNVVEKIEKTELMLQIVKLLGGQVFFSTDFKKAENNVLNADLCVQEALEDGGDSLSFAQQYIDEGWGLMKSMLLQIVSAFALFSAVIAVVLVLILHERSRKEQIPNYEHGY
jgi:hypothetical protein